MNHRALAVAKVNETIDRANEIYGLNLSYPMVKFNLRGRTAGTANSTTHTINLNEGLLIRNLDTFLADTCVHEVAHLVQYKLHPTQRRWTGRKWVRTIQPHGYEWQQVMRAFGVAPERCHQMDTTEVRVKKNVVKYEYKCNCKTHEVGGKIHNKIQMGYTYTCRSCKGKLTTGSFVQPIAPVAPVVPVYNPPKRSEPATNLPKTGSKKERAEWLYRMHKNLTRERIIEKFMEELNMTKSGASTYYYNCTKACG